MACVQLPSFRLPVTVSLFIFLFLLGTEDCSASGNIFTGDDDGSTDLEKARSGDNDDMGGNEFDDIGWRGNDDFISMLDDTVRASLGNDEFRGPMGDGMGSSSLDGQDSNDNGATDYETVSPFLETAVPVASFEDLFSPETGTAVPGPEADNGTVIPNLGTMEPGSETINPSIMNTPFISRDGTMPPGYDETGFIGTLNPNIGYDLIGPEEHNTGGTIDFDDTGGSNYDIGSGLFPTASPSSASSSMAWYSIESWLCDPNQMEAYTHPARMLPKKVMHDNIKQGDLITVCVAPNDAAYKDGIVMSDLLDFRWQIGGRDRQHAIKNGQAGDSMTEYKPSKCSGAEWCTFSSILYGQFYKSPESVTGSGNANLKKNPDIIVPEPFFFDLTLFTASHSNQFETAEPTTMGPTSAPTAWETASPTYSRNENEIEELTETDHITNLTNHWKNITANSPEKEEKEGLGVGPILGVVTVVLVFVGYAVFTTFTIRCVKGRQSSNNNEDKGEDDEDYEEYSRQDASNASESEWEEEAPTPSRTALLTNAQNIISGSIRKMQEKATPTLRKIQERATPTLRKMQERVSSFRFQKPTETETNEGDIEAPLGKKIPLKSDENPDGFSDTDSTDEIEHTSFHEDEDDATSQMLADFTDEENAPGSPGTLDISRNYVDEDALPFGGRIVQKTIDPLSNALKIFDEETPRKTRQPPKATDEVSIALSKFIDEENPESSDSDDENTSKPLSEFFDEPKEEVQKRRSLKMDDALNNAFEEIVKMDESISDAISVAFEELVAKGSPLTPLNTVKEISKTSSEFNDEPMDEEDSPKPSMDEDNTFHGSSLEDLISQPINNDNHKSNVLSEFIDEFTPQSFHDDRGFFQ